MGGECGVEKWAEEMLARDRAAIGQVAAAEEVHRLQAEGHHQDRPDDKPADMRPPGDAAARPAGGRLGALVSAITIGWY